MGFFSDLKEDLSQAVNELMPEEEKVKEDEPMSLDDPGLSLDEMLKNIDDFQLPEELENPAVPPEVEGQEAAGFAVPEEEDAATEGTEIYGGYTAEAVMEESGVYGDYTAEAEVDTVTAGTETYGDLTAESASDAEMEDLLTQMLEESSDGEPVPEAQEEAMENETIMEENKGEEEDMDMLEEMELERDREVSDETSIITEGMTITGDIATQGSIDVIGTVNGNIDAMGKLNITGHVNGNSKAAEIYAENAKINGEIVSEGAVKIGASSVIIGNISAASAAIAGAVKGDIDVKGPVILDASAIVMGNIKSKSVQINNGAVIEGMCSQCYADVSPTSFFEEYKPENTRKTKAKQS